MYFAKQPSCPYFLYQLNNNIFFSFCIYLICKQKLYIMKCNTKKTTPSQMTAPFLPNLSKFRQIINQLLCLFPSQARIRNRLSVTMPADCLGTVFQITFNHQSLDDFSYVVRHPAAMHNVFADADLFQEIFPGIRMVCINHHRRIRNFFFSI